MIALANIFGFLFQFLVLAVIAHSKGIIFLGEYSLVLSMISPFCIVFSLGLKNRYFSGGLDFTEIKPIVGMRNVFFMVVIFLALLSIIYGGYACAIALLVKAFEIYVDSLIVFKTGFFNVIFTPILCACVLVLGVFNPVCLYVFIPVLVVLYFWRNLSFSFSGLVVIDGFKYSNILFYQNLAVMVQRMMFASFFGYSVLAIVTVLSYFFVITTLVTQSIYYQFVGRGLSFVLRIIIALWVLLILPYFSLADYFTSTLFLVSVGVETLLVVYVGVLIVSLDVYYYYARVQSGSYSYFYLALISLAALLLFSIVNPGHEFEVMVNIVLMYLVRLALNLFMYKKVIR
ncbi:hypothetical protein [Thalassolituus pacificus]|uniref:Polysaccharide biosynthesis protein n=1 Tax=Thalassolituus pacificus TaxID=2975440 RepID=A0A9X2WGK4_9GAMM|nr:hypothetical protein [Thalassolituus pacificus]MCT7360096.1 hypothetical protein [Thalassolituus pacificus]